MSRPTAEHESNTKHVVIVGAGPSGLLLTNLLLERNRQSDHEGGNGQPRPKYKVTVIDSRIDMGLLDVKKELSNYRSWMIGLAGHGLEALRTLPKLYQDYAMKPHVGVPIEEIALYLGKTEIRTSAATRNDYKAGNTITGSEGYVVDRNYIVAALAQYMDDEHKDNKEFLVRRYQTSLQYVDSSNRRVLIRDNRTNEEEYVPYDLLVGADGSRSVVRESLLRDCYDFECDFGDIFNEFRAVHVTKPNALGPNQMTILPECFPGMNGIALPMPNNLVNISFGASRNNSHAVPAELKSSDPTVVANYVRSHFKAFELADYDDFAQKWIGNGRWNRTAMVHCNRYHNTETRVVIMGDAAHATSPSIGMGMNTALRDAQVFVELLDAHKDNLDLVLPAFSEARVKEGNSLTDLAFHLTCLDRTTQLIETLHLLVRSKLHSWFPSWINQHAQVLIGIPEYSLARVYQIAMEQGIIAKHRVINNKVRQDYFERESGMLSADFGKRTRKGQIFSAIVVGLVAVMGYYGWMNGTM